MSRLVNCRCDKPSPGGLAEEPCTRKVTQEDMLCDVCRSGCNLVSISPVVGKVVPANHGRNIANHAEVSFNMRRVDA